MIEWRGVIADLVASERAYGKIWWARAVARARRNAASQARSSTAACADDAVAKIKAEAPSLDQG